MSHTSFVLSETPERVLDPSGDALVGAYAGGLHRVDLNPGDELSLVQRLRQAFSHKKWHFVGIATDKIFLTAALVDGGYAANGFLCLVDLETGTTLKNLSFLGVPRLSVSVNDRPGQGAMAWLKQPGARFEFWRPERSAKYRLSVQLKDLEIDAALDTRQAPAPLAVIGKPRDRLVAFTQKTNLLETTGKIKIAGRKISLDGAWGGLDYSAGYFPRITEWRWAFAMGRLADGKRIGLNLADGNNLGGQNENALWLGDKLFRLAPAQFFFDRKNVVANWKLKTDDDLINLTFTPKGVHREDREYVLVRSRFAQVLGRYDGTIRDPETGSRYDVVNLPGVAEDQRVKW